jgi:protein TIF31
LPLPQKNVINPLQELYLNPLAKEMSKVKHIKCVESISYSAFNPVPTERKMVGDLFYLVVRTIDNGEHGITSNLDGFYKNDCVERGVFSPGPSTKQSACHSYTLVGTIHQLSTTFGKNLEEYLNSILNTEPYFLTQPV